MDHRVGVVNIIHHLVEEPSWPDLRARPTFLLEAIIDRAREDDAVPVGFGPRGIAFAILRFSRPLAIGLPLHEERALAHAQIDTFVDGLLSSARDADRTP